MKKVIIGFLILLVVLIASAVVLPVIFKDDIKAAIDKELANSVNADVVFDVDDFSLSIFSNFPNITASMKNLGVINRAPFEGEILFAAEEFNVEINLSSLLFGDTPGIKGITLVRPVINIKVLADGAANYDIAIPSDETEEVTEEGSGEFSFKIDHWEVIDGEFVYDDLTIPYYMKLVGLDHSGSGDFTQDVFDLTTNSHADSVFVGYDGDMYIEGKSADIEAVISISDDISKYTFKENKAKINDFALSFDGWFFMGADYYDMDITYGAVDNTFKSLLSLIPGMYTADFKDLEAAGNLSFNGMVKGKYTDTDMPAFNVSMLVENGMFKYPDLPTAVENIALDMTIDNKDGIIDNTSIDIKNFHMDLGKNPVDAKMSIANLTNYKTKANIKATLDLSELNKMFPVDGLDMKGKFALDMNAEGTYDSTLKTMPTLAGTMSLNNGYFKSVEFPLPIEDLHFNTSLENKSGLMKDFIARITNFAMVLDGESFNADVLFKNLDNYQWDIKAGGGIDLAKITSIFPLEGMELAGHIVANLETKGDMAAVDAEKYDQLPTSGNMTIENFSYKDVTLPYDVKISKAEASFNPQKLNLTSFNATVGKSDMQMNGQVNNYIGYIFHENELLSGTFNFNSNLLDLNELMPESEETEETSSDTTSYSVIPVPKNIDFVLNSTIKQLKFMDLDIDNASGEIIIRDGIVNMNDLKFKMLGGSFLMAGSYDTQDPKDPKYNYKLKIDELGIKESFQAFSIVKILAPVAEVMNGKISTDFSISGGLKDNFMPKLETITGSGLLKVIQASLGDSQILSGLSTVTKLDDTKSVSLKDVVMKASVSDGKLKVSPFDVKIGEYAGTVEGQTGIDGSVAYNIKMDVPAGKFGSQLTSLTSQLGMGEVKEDSMIPLNIGMGGTVKAPKFQLMGSGQKQEVKEVLADKAKEEVKDASKDAIKNLTQGTEAGNVVQSLLGNKKDSTATDSTKADIKQQVEDKAKDAVKNLLKKKKTGN